MMDEPNDKTDKSCITLARVYSSSVGDDCTKFLDMPIVNIGTVRNLFDPLKLLLISYILEVLGFYDTTNVMKGARSGVQILIRNECPCVLDVGCICHLADLAAKSSMKALPVDIDQLL